MRDYLKFAITSIKHRKLRSWLTIIGIVIGIAAIISLISVSQGLENAILDQFERMGTNKIFVMPSGVEAVSMQQKRLTIDDVDAMKSMDEFEWVNSYLFGSGEVRLGTRKKFAEFIRGYDTEDMEKSFSDYDIQLSEGRYLNKNEKYGAIIGYDFAHSLFDKDIIVGNNIELKGVKFRVVGIVEEIGTEDDDYSVFIPMSAARELFDEPEKVSMIEAKLKEGVDIDLAADKARKRLKKIRGDEDFSVVTPAQLLEQLGSILNVLRVVLGGIAAISILVGAIGIMNSMFTNVLERKKEIGIMKAIGASPRDILMIFMTEAGVVGIIGGIFGVLFGTIVAFAIEKIAISYGFKFIDIRIDFWLILFGLTFAFVIGSLAGYFPAKRAAKLMPVDALRD